MNRSLTWTTSASECRTSQPTLWRLCTSASESGGCVLPPARGGISWYHQPEQNGRLAFEGVRSYARRKSLLLDVRIAEWDGVKVLGAPVGTDALCDGERDGDRLKTWNGTTRAHARHAVSQPYFYRLHGPADGQHRASDGPGVVPACILQCRQKTRYRCWNTCLTSPGKPKNRRCSRTGARRLN